MNTTKWLVETNIYWSQPQLASHTSNTQATIQKAVFYFLEQIFGFCFVHTHTLGQFIIVMIGVEVKL